MVANSGFGTGSHLLVAAFCGFLTYLLIHRMIRNRTVSLVLALLGIAYWAGLIAAGVGLAHTLFGGASAWSVGPFAYAIVGTALAFLAYRGRTAFGAKSNEFPTI